MTSYTVAIELDRAFTPELAAMAAEDLADHHPVIGRSRGDLGLVSGCGQQE